MAKTYKIVAKHGGRYYNIYWHSKGVIAKNMEIKEGAHEKVQGRISKSSQFND
jgi:hypothetical protein